MSEEAPKIKATPTRVSVIIPCRNEAQYIGPCLDSILAQTALSSGTSAEVLVADGMSDDGTRDILKGIMARGPGVRLIDNPGLIVSTGLNRAIKAATGEIILRMDVHTEYAPDYNAKCLEAMGSTNAWNVGGPARTKAKGYLQQAVRLAYHSPFSVGGARFHNENYEGPVDTVTYGCWKKTTLMDIGLFDEELVRNQDDELNLRIIRRGGIVWQSRDIRSWYYPRDSISALSRQYAQYGYWKVRVIQKHRIPASWRHLVPGGFLLSLLILAALSLVNVLFGLTLAVVIGAYVTANLIASAVACGSWSKLRYLPVMPLVFASYHFGYGYGFLWGMVDFAILKRGSREAFTVLSRHDKS